MVQDWQALIENMNGALKDLRQGGPDVMKSFSDLSKAAHAGTALDHKTKELIALAIGVATRCAPCIAYHAEGAAKAGASREEIVETMGVSVYMGAGPSLMYAAQALEAFTQLSGVAPQAA
jgi:AhpD family alkylhydroperoxidase